MNEKNRYYFIDLVKMDCAYPDAIPSVSSICRRLGLSRTSLLKACREGRALHGRWLLVREDPAWTDPQAELRKIYGGMKPQPSKFRGVKCRMIRDGKVVREFASLSGAKKFLGLDARATTQALHARAAQRGHLVELGDWIHPSRTPSR